MMLRRSRIGVFSCLAAGAVLCVATAIVRADDLPGPVANGDAVGAPQGIADLKALEGKFQATVARVTPSVVSVFGASGVVVTGDGYVLTVAHVGQRAGRELEVVFPDGRRAKAVTLGNDHGLDAGMVKITDPGPWPYSELGDSDDLKPGMWCLTLGYPMTAENGKPPLVRIGRVLFNHRNEIIADGTIMGGDSGAPLFSIEGKLVGIGSKCINALVWNIHVPINRFRDLWKPLAKGEDFDSLAPKPAFLGVGPVEGNQEPRIGSIEPGSAAEKAGLRTGDVILTFEGHALQRFDELPPLVREHKAGCKVRIEIRRGAEKLNIEAILGEDPGQDL